MLDVVEGATDDIQLRLEMAWQTLSYLFVPLDVVWIIPTIFTAKNEEEEEEVMLAGEVHYIYVKYVEDTDWMDHLGQAYRLARWTGKCVKRQSSCVNNPYNFWLTVFVCHTSVEFPFEPQPAREHWMSWCHQEIWDLLLALHNTPLTQEPMQIV